jgi:hypothetical protein
LTIIASQALEFSSTVSQVLQSGHLWQWVAAKLDAVKGYLHHLNLPFGGQRHHLGASRPYLLLTGHVGAGVGLIPWGGAWNPSYIEPIYIN